MGARFKIITTGGAEVKAGTVRSSAVRRVWVLYAKDVRSRATANRSHARRHQFPQATWNDQSRRGGAGARATGIRRVGHTGTLDPAAAGVLPICVGQATRLVEYLQAGTKEYVAELTFGYETDTLDAVGTVIRRGDASDVTLERLSQALDGFRGTIEQTPPIYSAIKQGGQKLYELARAGADVDDVEIKSRAVTISTLVVSKFTDGGDKTLPRAMLDIECTGGTYIRSLARDIGPRLVAARR